MNFLLTLAILSTVVTIVCLAFAKPGKTWRLAVDLAMTGITLVILFEGLPLLLNAANTFANILGVSIIVAFAIGVVALVHKRLTSNS